MKIDDELLDKLQKMAMLEIDEDKREEVKSQLSEILAFLENLKKIKTDEIEVSCVRGTSLREDEVRDSKVYQDVLRYAPCAEDEFFVVPKILE